MWSLRTYWQVNLKGIYWTLCAHLCSIRRNLFGLLLLIKALKELIEPRILYVGPCSTSTRPIKEGGHSLYCTRTITERELMERADFMDRGLSARCDQMVGETGHFAFGVEMDVGPEFQVISNKEVHFKFAAALGFRIMKI